MSFVVRLAGIARVVRPGNLAIVFVGCLTGAVLAGGFTALRPGFLRPALIAAFAALLVAAGSNALNDAMDLESDRVNRPARPIPSGVVSRRQAIGVWLATSVVALFLSASLSGLHFVVAASITVLLLAYNVWLKHVPVVGNLAVSGCVAAALIFGGLSEGPNVDVVAAALFALLTTFAREVVKDLQDERGDRLAGSRTLVATAGPRASRFAAASVIAVALAAIPVPYMFMSFSGTYLLIATLAGGGLCGALLALIEARDDRGARAETPDHPVMMLYGRTSLMLKLSMVLGLIALLLARFPE